jgi:hypothetical protein
MNTALIFNYLIFISICGVVLFGIISLLCFTGAEIFKLEEEVRIKRGVEMIIVSIVMLSFK